MNIRDLAEVKTYQLSQALDICEHAGHFNDWTANNYRQLTRPRHFYGVVACASFSSQLQIVYETLEGDMLEQIGELSADKIMLCSLLAGPRIILNGQVLEPGSTYMSCQMPLHAVIPQPIRVSLITIDRGLFFERFRIRSSAVKQNAPFEVFLGQENGGVDAMNRTVTAVFRALQSAATSPEEIGALLECLFTDIQQMIQYADVRSAATLPVHRALVVTQGCEVFNRCYGDEDFGVIDLCQQLGVSRRTLQYSFESVLGVAPLQYMRAVRLNAAYQKLRVANPGQVQSAALDSGFSHLGRFSRYYREFFGELPSETVARSQHRLS